MSFRVNGQPVQGMFENFTTDGLLFPVASFSAGVRWVQTETQVIHDSGELYSGESYPLQPLCPDGDSSLFIVYL